jgi:hypothetical protein
MSPPLLIYVANCQVFWVNNFFTKALPELCSRFLFPVYSADMPDTTAHEHSESRRAKSAEVCVGISALIQD